MHMKLPQIAEIIDLFISASKLAVQHKKLSYPIRDG